MESKHPQAEIAAVVRAKMAQHTRMIHTDLEDLERRRAQGWPPILSRLAVRALQSNLAQLADLASELVGLESE